MYLLSRLIFIAIFLYIYVITFIDDTKISERNDNNLSDKLYLFLFMFIIQFLSHMFTNLLSGTKIIINSLVDSSINSALLAVIAYDVYYDLRFKDFFSNYSPNQKQITLTLLIVAFVTGIKVINLMMICGN